MVPLSFRTVLAPGSGLSSSQDTRPGPRLQQLWLQLPDGKRKYLGPKSLSRLQSAHSSGFLRDLQVVEGQQGKGLRKGMERSKIRAHGQRWQWGKGAERPIRPFPPHQAIPEKKSGSKSSPTNPQNSGSLGNLSCFCFRFGRRVGKGTTKYVDFLLHHIFKNGKDSMKNLGFISLKKKKTKILEILGLSSSSARIC